MNETRKILEAFNGLANDLAIDDGSMRGAVGGMVDALWRKYAIPGEPSMIEWPEDGTAPRVPEA